VAQLRDKAEDFENIPARVVLVGMGSPKESKAFIKRFQIPFPLICDPERSLYGAYGLKRMGVLDFISPSLAIKSLSAVAQGNLAGIPQGDVKQLAGVFVIDAYGVIQYRHLSADPADFPSAEDVLGVVKSISNQAVS